MSLFAAIYVTMGIIAGMYGHYNGLYLQLLLATIVYAVGVVCSLKCHYTSYLLVIAASIIAILATFIIKLIDDGVAATLVAGLFIIGCVAILSRIIYRLNQQWHGTN